MVLCDYRSIHDNKEISNSKDLEYYLKNLATAFAIFAVLMVCRAQNLNKFCPFTMEQCQLEPYIRLKSCQLSNMKPTQLTELSDKIPCHNTIIFNNTEQGSRERRSVDHCNTCIDNTYAQIIYLAEDAQYGTNELMELVHDPGMHRYQALKVEECNEVATFTGQGQTHSCKQEMVEFAAAVFYNPYSYEMRVQQVRYPATCNIIQNGCY